MAMLLSATNRAMTKRVAAEMADTPTARPSRPSIKFTALVMATIQTMVMGTDHLPRSRYCTELVTMGLEK